MACGIFWTISHNHNMWELQNLKIDGKNRPSQKWLQLTNKFFLIGLILIFGYLFIVLKIDSKKYFWFIHSSINVAFSSIIKLLKLMNESSGCFSFKYWEKRLHVCNISVVNKSRFHSNFYIIRDFWRRKNMLTLQRLTFYFSIFAFVFIQQ